MRDVDGRRISIQVDKLKNGAHLLYRGGIVRNVAVASYKISKGLAHRDGMRTWQVATATYLNRALPAWGIHVRVRRSAHPGRPDQNRPG